MVEFTKLRSEFVLERVTGGKQRGSETKSEVDKSSGAAVARKVSAKGSETETRCGLENDRETSEEDDASGESESDESFLRSSDNPDTSSGRPSRSRGSSSGDRGLSVGPGGCSGSAARGGRPGGPRS